MTDVIDTPAYDEMEEPVLETKGSDLQDEAPEPLDESNVDFNEAMKDRHKSDLRAYMGDFNEEATENPETSYYAGYEEALESTNRLSMERHSSDMRVYMDGFAAEGNPMRANQAQPMDALEEAEANTNKLMLERHKSDMQAYINGFVLDEDEEDEGSYQNGEENENQNGEENEKQNGEDHENENNENNGENVENTDEVQEEEAPPPSKYKRSKIVKPSKNRAPAEVHDKPPKTKKGPYVPSASLMYTTEARKRDSLALKEQREMKKLEQVEKDKFLKAQRRPKKPIPPPSEHLLQPTQNRISDIREWEEQKSRMKDDEDIWWEKRKDVGRAKPMNVPSKFLNPTTATLVAKRDKHEPPKETNKRRSFMKIDSQSPLLKPTRMSICGSIMGDPDATPPPPPALYLETEYSSIGPHGIPSRLLNPTKAAAAARWKSKEEEEQEELARSGGSSISSRKVKAASERLSKYNTSMNRQARTKVEKPSADPREAGWSSTFHKDHIPPVDFTKLPGTRSSTDETHVTPTKIPKVSRKEKTPVTRHKSSTEVKLEESEGTDLDLMELREAQAQQAATPEE